MNSQLDEPLFATELDEQQPTSRRSPTAAWKVLVVDDEQSVHDVTRLALRSFEYEGQPLELLHAYSAQEAESLLRTEREIAAALVDVVMETQDAGLRLVQTIREDIGNRLLRIILRTGQPGQAPEGRVIREYDINDYKEKTELTATKLFTLMVASLRNYENLAALARAREGLLYIIESSNRLSTNQSLTSFIEGVLLQLQGMLAGGASGFYSRSLALLSDRSPAEAGRQIIIAGTGDFAGKATQRLGEFADPELLEAVDQTLRTRHSQFVRGGFVAYFGSRYGNHGVLYLGGGRRELDDTDRSLIDTFCLNTSFAFDNLHLTRELEETQHEIVTTLGTIAEFRSRETGRHIVRVAEIGRELGRLYGMDEEETELLALALPMHDIGKIAIPDSILHKPGPLDGDEWTVMQTHAELGYEMLAKSPRPLFRAAATIAREHHEWWNGQGYPRGLVGTQIHLYGRIAAIADVFDALGNARSYKEPWPAEQIAEHFRDLRGLQFDPELTDLLLDHLDEFTAIRERYADDAPEVPARPAATADGD